jgi:hypothetical protein
MPQTRAMFEFFAGLYQTERVVPTPADAATTGLRYAIVNNNNAIPWGLYQKIKRDEGVEWDVAPMPIWKPTGRKATQSGDTPNIVMKAAQRNNSLTEAVQLLFYMQGDFAGKALIQANAPGMPTKKTVVQGDEFLKKRPPMHVERVQDSFDSKNMFIQYPIFARSNQWLSAITPLWTRVLTGELSVSAFVQQGDEAANAALAAPVKF